MDIEQWNEERRKLGRLSGTLDVPVDVDTHSQFGASTVDVGPSGLRSVHKVPLEQPQMTTRRQQVLSLPSFTEYLRLAGFGTSEGSSRESMTTAFSPAVESTSPSEFGHDPSFGGRKPKGGRSTKSNAVTSDDEKRSPSSDGSSTIRPPSAVTVRR